MERAGVTLEQGCRYCNNMGGGCPKPLHTSLSINNLPLQTSQVEI